MYWMLVYPCSGLSYTLARGLLWGKHSLASIAWRAQPWHAHPVDTHPGIHLSAHHVHLGVYALARNALEGGERDYDLK